MSARTAQAITVSCYVVACLAFLAGGNVPMAMLMASLAFLWTVV